VASLLWIDLRGNHHHEKEVRRKFFKRRLMGQKGIFQFIHLKKEG
jgi:hypothetical protein